MLSKLHTANLFSISKTTLHELHFLSYPLSSAIESSKPPRLSDFFNTQHPKSADPNDEDFVIPSLAHWVETQKVFDPNMVIKTSQSDTKDSDLDAVSKILKNMYSSPDDVVLAFDGFDLNLSNSLVKRILKRFSNDWVPAFGFFNWAKVQTGYMHSPEIYNLMIDILGKSKNFELVWELVEEMYQLGGGYVTIETMEKVMRRLARARKYEEAIEAFGGIARFGLNKDVTVLNTLLDTLAKESGVEHAYDVFLEYKKSIPLNVYSYNILTLGWCKARRLDMARKIMEDMKKDGFVPDVVSYTCLVEAYCRDKDFRQVDAIFDEMKAKDCKPSIVTYTIVMHAYGKAKQINEAFDIYEKMKSFGCVPDASFYSSLIFILGKAGKLNEAHDVFEDMKKQGVNPDVVTYNTLISCACDHSQEETALKLLKKMEEDSCKPNLLTYAPLLKMCCRKNRMKVLNFLLNHMFMNDLSIEVGTYLLLINGLCKSGKVEQACSFFKEMVSKGLVPRDSSYKRLIKKLEEKSMMEAKQNIESLMLQAKREERT